jgi:hypothetical protein
MESVQAENAALLAPLDALEAKMRRFADKRTAVTEQE